VKLVSQECHARMNTAPLVLRACNVPIDLLILALLTYLIEVYSASCGTCQHYWNKVCVICGLSSMMKFIVSSATDCCDVSFILRR